MLINEVEHLVGLSKKSIRYYEENGLLSPTRNKINDYRIYNEKDIEKLKLIKFLRELNVGIKDLKKLENKKKKKKKCMLDRIRKIEEETTNYEKVKNMCKEISESNCEYNTINIKKYFENMSTLNKEGFTLRDVKTSKKKKICGAVLSSTIFSLIFILLIILTTYFQYTEEVNIPIIIYLVLMVMLFIPVIGIIYNLIIRINEIRKGEEDEASKY